MTVAGGALVASKMLRSKPGGVRLLIQRKNIQISHKLGLLTDLQAAAAYNDLSRFYGKLIQARPLVLGEARTNEARKTYYSGPWRPEMTQREARLILGVTEAYVYLLKSHCSPPFIDAKPIKPTFSTNTNLLFSSSARRKTAR